MSLAALGLVFPDYCEQISSRDENFEFGYRKEIRLGDIFEILHRLNSSTLIEGFYIDLERLANPTIVYLPAEGVLEITAEK